MSKEEANLHHILAVVKNGIEEIDIKEYRDAAKSAFWQSIQDWIAWATQKYAKK